MDFTFQYRFLRNRRTSPSGKGDLLKASQKLFESSENRLKLHLLIFIGLSLGVGFFGYSRSLVAARTQWLRENPPSLRTWTAFILQRGFHEVTESEQRSRLQSTLPYDLGTENELRIDEGDQTIALSRPEGTFIFTRQKNFNSSAFPKKNWERLGMGWEAITALERRVFYSETKGDDSSQKKVFKRELRDPKRIQY